MTSIDKIKLWCAALLVVGSVYLSFYRLEVQQSAARAGMFLGGLALACALVYFSAPGRRFIVFSRESFSELRKVVWPGRQETARLTGVVIAFVTAVGIFLWLVDLILGKLQLGLLSL